MADTLTEFYLEHGTGIKSEAIYLTESWWPHVTWRQGRSNFLCRWQLWVKFILHAGKVKFNLFCMLAKWNSIYSACWQSEIQFILHAGKVKFNLFCMLAKWNSIYSARWQSEIQFILHAGKLKFNLFCTLAKWNSIHWLKNEYPDLPVYTYL